MNLFGVSKSTVYRYVKTLKTEGSLPMDFGFRENRGKLKRNYEVLVLSNRFLKKEETNFVKFLEIEAENICEASDKFKVISLIREYLIRPTQKKEVVATIHAT